MKTYVKQNKTLLRSTAAALVLCATAAWYFWPVVNPITVKTYDQICPGMTREEVDNLLGGPGGTREDFTQWMNNRSPTIGSGTDLLNSRRNQPGIEYWYRDSGIIIVRFDSDKMVADKQFLQVQVTTSRQWIIRLRDRFGW